MHFLKLRVTMFVSCASLGRAWLSTRMQARAKLSMEVQFNLAQSRAMRLPRGGVDGPNDLSCFLPVVSSSVPPGFTPHSPQGTTLAGAAGALQLCMQLRTTPQGGHHQGVHRTHTAAGATSHTTRRGRAPPAGKGCDSDWLSERIRMEQRGSDSDEKERQRRLATPRGAGAQALAACEGPR
jgi:hypothetical protein